MFNEKDIELRTLYEALQTKDIRATKNILRESSALIRYKNQLGESLLHFAVKYNFDELVDCLINNHKLSIDTPDCCNRTPLHFAITRKNEVIVRRLLEHKASTIAKNLYGKSPFHLAVNFGDLRIIELLLSSGADIMDATSINHQTSLHIALRNEDTATFNLLLNNYSGNVNLPDSYGETLLHSLARQRDESSAKLLIDRAADVNFFNEDKETPLHLAIHQRNFGMCKLFVEHGADVTVKNKYGESSLHLAIRHKDFQLVQLLLSFHADVNQRAEDNDTMLHVAVNYYNSSVVDLLMKHRVEVDAKNIHGLTPFHTAIKIKCTDAAAQLLRYGTDVNTVAFGRFVQKGESRNYTPLHTAIKQKDVVAVKFLLENGASFDNDCEIFLAVEFGCANAIDLLVQHGANVNARNSSGRSVLYMAMKSRDRDKVEMLLHCGADLKNVNETDVDRSESTLHLAVRANDEKFVKFILDVGADVNICDGDGMTALCLADGTIARLIVASVALLKINGFFVCKKNASAINSVEELRLYFAKCTEELVKIRSTRYGNVSLIEFLRDDARFWGKYVRRGVFEATIDEKFYPTYWQKLLANIDKGVTRWNLIKRAKDTLCGFQFFQPLYDMLDDIVDNFNDDELRSFIRHTNEE